MQKQGCKIIQLTESTSAFVYNVVRLLYREVQKNCKVKDCLVGQFAHI